MWHGCQGNSYPIEVLLKWIRTTATKIIFTGGFCNKTATKGFCSGKMSAGTFNVERYVANCICDWKNDVAEKKWNSGSL